VLPKFLREIAFLREKLGPLLVQLPPDFQFEHTVVYEFLSRLRQSYQRDVVWEPRHSSWFGDRANDLLKKFQVVASLPTRLACRPRANRGANQILFIFGFMDPRSDIILLTIPNF
jgi:uncharacterized protein YecE (DUF72 family)